MLSCCSRKKQTLGGSIFLEGDALAIIYDGQNFTGASLKLGRTGMYSWCEGHIEGWNNRIRSVKVKPGYKVTLFMDCEYKEPYDPKLDIGAIYYDKEMDLFCDTPIIKDDMMDQGASAVTIEYTGETPKCASATRIIKKAPPRLRLRPAPPGFKSHDSWVPRAYTAPSVARCAGVKCLNGGKCVAGKCRCPAGFKPPFCADAEDPCDGVVCQNGGKCAGGKCKCSPSWKYAGAACQVDLDPKVGAVLYDQPNFKGKTLVLDQEGLYSWCTGELDFQWNNRIRSVRVAKGYRLTLHMNCDSAGPYSNVQVLERSTPVLEDDLDAGASAVTVEKASAPRQEVRMHSAEDGV